MSKRDEAGKTCFRNCSHNHVGQLYDGGSRVYTDLGNRYLAPVYHNRCRPAGFGDDNRLQRTKRRCPVRN